MPLLQKRVLNGLRSGGLGFLARIIIQLVQVPVLLSLWGGDHYGEWLILTAIPTYLGIAGMGLGTTVGNMVSGALAKNNTGEAQSLCRAAWTLLGLISAGILVLSILCTGIAYTFNLYSFKTISPAESSFTIVMLVFVVILRLQSGVIGEVALRARGRYGAAVNIETIAQIVELAATIFAAAVFGGFIAVAASLVAVRAILIASMILYLVFQDPALLGRGSLSVVSTCRKIAGPMFSLLLFPLAQAIQFEGTLLLIGYWFNPLMVSLYVSMRTLARLPDMVVIMAYNILMPEAAYLQGQDSNLRKQILLGVGTVACLVIAAITVAATWVGGILFFSTWTAGKLEYSTPLFLSVTGISLLRAIYISSSAIIVASNNHQRLAWINFFAAVLACCIAYIIGWSGGGLVAVSAAALMSEAILAIASIYFATKMINASLFACIAAAKPHVYENIIKIKCKNRNVL